MFASIPVASATARCVGAGRSRPWTWSSAARTKNCGGVTATSASSAASAARQAWAAVTSAAQEGRLDRDRLRRTPVDEALASLQAIPGIGPFFARGILYRGAGVVDDVAEGDVTRFAVTKRYGLGALADQARVLEIAEAWRPYRMWAAVLLHVWVRSEIGLPRRRPPAARPAATRPRPTGRTGGSRSPQKPVS